MGYPWNLVSSLALHCVIDRCVDMLLTMLSTSWNQGQACCAGSRIYVQSGIYDKFLHEFTEETKALKLGDPFAPGVDQGPQVSLAQYDVCNKRDFEEITNLGPRRPENYGLHQIGTRGRGYVSSGWIEVWFGRLLHPTYDLYRYEAGYEDR